jgi:hypothetical protein
MTTPTLESARFHLKAADDGLLINGDRTTAIRQINLAEISLSLLNMSSGYINESNSSNRVYHRRLFIKHEDGGKLYN